MSIVTCDQLQKFYSDPTNTGTDSALQIYGDAALFFASQGGCSTSIPPEIVYNSYCGTPSLNTNYKQSCTNLLNIGGAKDSQDLIFNKIVQQNFPNFDYTTVRQFAGYAFPNLEFSNAPPLIQSSFSGAVVASLSKESSTLIVATSGKIQLQTLISNVISFCMANENGLIYYVKTNGHTFTYNAITKVETQISNTPMVNLPERMISCALPDISLACFSLADKDNIYRFDFTTFDWGTVPLPAAIFRFNLDMAMDFAGTTLIFGAALTSSSDSEVYIVSPFLIRNQTNNGHFQMLAVWDTISNTAIIINDLTDLTDDSVKLPIHTGEPILGVFWGPQQNQYVCFVQYKGIYYSPIRPTVNSDWTQLSTSIQSINSPASISSLSLALASQVIYWPEYIPATATFSIRYATFNANPLSYFLTGLSKLGFFYLLDNGEIRCYDSKSITASVIWTSSTNDQSVPSSTLLSNGGYVEVIAVDNPITVSNNGLYMVTFDSATGLFSLLQNVINGTEIVTWGASSKLPELRTSFKINYCANLPTNDKTGTITNTFPDPRCLCYYPRELTASLFDVDLLASNPAQLALIDSISPCLFGTCTQTRAAGTITSTLMDSVVKCPNAITLCSTIINIGQEGSINAGKGGVNVDTNCAGATGQTPCSSTCPVGMACAKNNFCSPICDTNADCLGAGQKCLKGVCESSTDANEPLPDWAIVLIAIGAALVLIGIALAIYYTRRKHV
jgi:hypothetical protein